MGAIVGLRLFISCLSRITVFSFLTFNILKVSSCILWACARVFLYFRDGVTLVPVTSSWLEVDTIITPLASSRWLQGAILLPLLRVFLFPLIPLSSLIFFFL